MDEEHKFIKPLSAEAVIALLVALINLALDQADIHIMLVSWISVLACIVLFIDALRRLKWSSKVGYKSKKFLGICMLVVLVFLGFGVFLSRDRKLPELTQSRSFSKPQSDIQKSSGASEPQGYTAVRQSSLQPPLHKPMATEGKSLISHKGVNLGKDAVGMGHIPDGTRIGDGSVMVGPTDALGNTILNRGGLAVGNGARADSTSIAIGAHANAGGGGTSSKPISELPTEPQSQTTVNAPNGIAISGGNVSNPTVNNFRSPRPPPPTHFEQRQLAPVPQDPPSSDPRINKGNFLANMAEGRLNDKYPGVALTIVLDGGFYEPAFIVQCSSPCSLSPNGVRSIDVKSVEIEILSFGDPTIYGVRFLSPQQMQSGTRILMELRSVDATKITVTSAGSYVQPIKEK